MGYTSHIPMRPLARWSVVALALVAAGCFSLSVVAGAWWSAGPVQIGPHGAQNCYGGPGGCGLGWIGAGERWETLGLGTWASGLIASLLLVIIAAGVAGKRLPKAFAKMFLVTTVMAIVLGIMFFTGFPGLSGAGIDRGVLLFGIGIGFGVAASITVLRARR